MLRIEHKVMSQDLLSVSDLHHKDIIAPEEVKIVMAEASLQEYLNFV